MIFFLQSKGHKDQRKKHQAKVKTHGNDLIFAVLTALTG